MKNIQDVMIEMDNLSKELTTKMSDGTNEEFVADEAVEGQECAVLRPSNRRSVEFSCAIVLPNQHRKKNIIKRDELTKVLFDLGCLDCIVVPTCEGIAGTPRYEVKVVGCIPFTVNVPVKKQRNQCVEKQYTRNCLIGMEEENACEEIEETSNDVRSEYSRCSHEDHVVLCCSNSVCVNETVCYKCNREQAAIACFIVKQKLKNCRCVRVRNLRVCQDNNDSLIIVKGRFELPNCNMPSRVVWDCD